MEPDLSRALQTAPVLPAIKPTEVPKGAALRDVAGGQPAASTVRPVAPVSTAKAADQPGALEDDDDDDDIEGTSEDPSTPRCCCVVLGSVSRHIARSPAPDTINTAGARRYPVPHLCQLRLQLQRALPRRQVLTAEVETRRPSEARFARH